MKYKSMKIKVLLLFLFLMLFPIFLYMGEVKAEENGKNSTSLKLYAQSAILMDAGSGRILSEKNSEEIRPMASTTKIMTCILALEYGNLEDFVEVSSYAASMPKVKLNMRAASNSFKYSTFNSSKSFRCSLGMSRTVELRFFIFKKSTNLFFSLMRKSK